MLRNKTSPLTGHLHSKEHPEQSCSIVAECQRGGGTPEPRIVGGAPILVGTYRLLQSYSQTPHLVRPRELMALLYRPPAAPTILGGCLLLRAAVDFERPTPRSASVWCRAAAVRAYHRSLPQWHMYHPTAEALLQCHPPQRRPPQHHSPRRWWVVRTRWPERCLRLQQELVIRR